MLLYNRGGGKLSVFQVLCLVDRMLTSLLISSCLSGAERAVALIMVDVWLSVSFLMQRCPATMLQT